MSSGKVNLAEAMRSAGLDATASAELVARHKPTYTELLGFFPPRVEARLTFTGALDPKIVEMQEALRTHAMDTPHLDPKVTQLLLFGMLLMDGNDAAETHAIAARHEGASWQELQAAVSLCFLFRGLPAANRGADTLARVAAREAQAAPA